MKRILIVEDNPIEALEIAGFLREAGFHVEVSGDAESGFARLSSEQFDVLLCDLHLPGENGFGLCRRVKQSNALRIPVVLLTHHADPLNFLRGLEAGADGFISKQHNAANICERLDRVLAQYDTQARDSTNETDRVVFLETEFDINAQRRQLLEVLLSGFEDVALLNSRYEEELAARIAAQKAMRESEARFQEMAAHLEDVLWMTSADGNEIIYASPAYESIWGRSYRRLREHAADWMEGVHPEDRERVAEAFYELAPLDDFDETFRVVRPDGSTSWVHATAKPILDEAGNVCRIAGIIRDVTQGQEANEQLRDAKRQAEEADQAKSQFLASMSHELRTPLNGVIGMAELLAETDLTERQRQFVDACRNSGQSLLHLINDILDFSKIEAGKLELDLHDLDLEKLVTDTADTMAWHASDKGLEIACFVDTPSRTIVKGDGSRLRQILVNLLGNAIKFTESGEVAVRAERVSQMDDQITVRFSVSDTGIGIPADKLDRLFQSFSQVSTDTTRNHGGTGLGLAISRSLVELMGGTIGVDSEAGEGSTFWFEVPFTLVSASRKDVSGQSQLAGLRALIVDDNETNRIIIAEYASGWGLASVSKASVDEALAAVNSAQAAGSPFHVVLTDYNMPGRNGLELSRALKNHPELVVLLLGSTDTCVNPDQLRDHGIDAILRKPLRRRELYDVLCGVLVPTETVLTPTGKESEPENGVTRLSGHVLLAEDNNINRLYVVELMKQLGCTCDTVNNGREAAEAVRQRKYDLVLMDCQMPEMNGFEATRLVRQMEANGTIDGQLPIVALTANAIRGDRERCLEAGMDDYLAKPVEKSQVIGVLERFLRDTQAHSPRTEAAGDSDSLNEKTLIGRDRA